MRLGSYPFYKLLCKVAKENDMEIPNPDQYASAENGEICRCGTLFLWPNTVEGCNYWSELDDKFCKKYGTGEYGYAYNLFELAKKDNLQLEFDFEEATI